MNEPDKHITDEDLVLLFYGEHDDPALAVTVAESETLSARYEALCQELKRADAYAPPGRDEDYGAEVWQRISPRLEDRRLARPGGFRTWLSSFMQPRFSLAGALALALVALVAFSLGRQSGPEISGQGGPVELVNDSTFSPSLADIDPNRLLLHSVATHLEQVNRMLTRFVNNSEAGTGEADDATDMLVANRLYRRAAQSKGDTKLASFLAELEPLLMELAYQAQAGSPLTRERMQHEVKDGLLLRVRIMNSQLSANQIST